MQRKEVLVEELEVMTLKQHKFRPYQCYYFLFCTITQLFLGSVLIAM